MTKLFDTREVILENGIKLVTIKKDTKLFSLNIGIKAGSLFEKKSEKGISHFIEHMLFKGTERRNNEKLNSELEELGGEYNAYTEYNSTVYTITALRDELEEAIDLLSDMLINSKFPEEEIEKEREVILSELRSSYDDIEEFSFKKINEAAFKNSPLRYEIIGDEKIIKKITKNTLVNFYKNYYVPNNCCISIVSSFEHEAIEMVIKKYFGMWSYKELKHPEVPVEKNKAVIKKIHKKDIEQSSIIYLYTFHNLDRMEELALKILEHKLGSSTNSILFREVRENQGLAYEVYSELNTTRNIKTLYIYTSVKEDNIDETIITIDKTIDRIINKEIVFDEKTIALMKKILKTAVVSTIEDSTEIGNYVLHQALDEEQLFQFVDDMERIDSVKAEDLYNVAKKVFYDATVHIVLPCESE
ncbi:MAG: M16 family metallopeptidase [Clostridiaceae bacterium]